MPRPLIVTDWHLQRAKTVTTPYKMTPDPRSEEGWTLLQRMRHRVAIDILRAGGYVSHSQRNKWGLHRGTYRVRFRGYPGGPLLLGYIRIPVQRSCVWRRDAKQKGLDAVMRPPRKHWLFILYRPKYAPRKPPHVWFLCFPDGGCLVIPNHVLGPTWRGIRLPEHSPGFWMWGFWQRFDVLAHYPNVPDDLVRDGATPTSMPAVTESESSHTACTNASADDAPAMGIQS